LLESLLRETRYVREGLAGFRCRGGVGVQSLYRKPTGAFGTNLPFFFRGNNYLQMGLSSSTGLGWASITLYLYI
jgi:hypothetical protein